MIGGESLFLGRKGDRCLFYAHAPRLACSDHLNGVDSDRLDFRVNPKLLRE